MAEVDGREKRFSTCRMLAFLHESRLAIADWRRHLAADFSFVHPFLFECTGEIASTVPCPHSGQRLNVAERGGRYAAYPDEGDEADSDPLTNLSLADVTPWRLNRGAFEQELCGALDLTPVTSSTTSQEAARLIGTTGTGENRKRVYLGYAGTEQDGMALCVSVVQNNRQRCCVVLPAFFPLCDEYLRRCDHDMVVLDEAVAFGENGLGAKRRETPRDIEDLVTVDVVGDYKALKLRDGTVIDLAQRTKCRAFVRYLHQRRKTTGNREFFYDEEIEKLNAGQKRILIQSDDFKFGLFRGIYQHFDLLFTVLDKGNGKYRINF